MAGIRFFCLLLSAVFVFSTVENLYSATPADPLWVFFSENNSLQPLYPEDTVLGVLAAAPDEIINTCIKAENFIRKGIIPDDLFYPPLSVPLAITFSNALSEGGCSIHVRYAIPETDGRHASVHIRITDGEIVKYGWIYLINNNGTWQLEQWEADLSDFKKLPPADSDR